MTKTTNKFSSLAQIEFVEDIDQEAAANYSGGEGRINDGNNNPDVILYEDENLQARSIGINAAIGDGVSYVGNSFNDKASSLRIIRGQWQFFNDDGYRGAKVVNNTFGPGDYNLTGANNDILSSLRRVG